MVAVSRAFGESSAHALALRSRNWLFTVNTIFDGIDGVLERLGGNSQVRYLVYGRELAPSTGHLHLQGFVIFKNAKKFIHAKEFFKDVVCDLRFGDDKSHAMMLYCKKDGNFKEFGVAPISRKERSSMGGKKKGVNFKKVIDLAMKGDMNRIRIKYPKQYMAYYRTLLAIHKDHGIRPPDLEAVTGIWIYGPSGSGKSHYARDEYPESYDKACNKWWDNYNSESNVLLDDFDLKHSCLGHHLKRWADRYAFSGEVKGSQMNLRPANIIVTSQYRISEIWASEPETIEALNRRFIKIKIHIDSQGNRVIQHQGF